MKLKNKKTDEETELIGILVKDGRSFFRFDDGKGVFKKEYETIAKFNAEWCDVEG